MPEARTGEREWSKPYGVENFPSGLSLVDLEYVEIIGTMKYGSVFYHLKGKRFKQNRTLHLNSSVQFTVRGKNTPFSETSNFQAELSCNP